jgi:TP901 family phage tail tape measure protein
MSDVIGFDKLFNASSFDEGTKLIAQYIQRITEQIGLAKGAADQLTASLGKELKNEIAQLSAQSQNLAKDMADMANKMANFQQTTSNTKKVLSDYEKENEKLRKELERLKVAQEGTTKATKASGTAFTKQLQSMLGLASGAAIVYRGITMLTEQFKLALASTMKFEQAMKEVQAISRASAEELRLLTENANRLGATTEKTAGEIAKLQKELGKLGFNTTEILASTDAIVNLSTATGEDLASSATIAASTLRAFGLEAIEMDRVVNVMTGSFVRSGLDLEKFRESIKLVAPIARATNIDLETTTAALSKLADAGLSGSLAGTALRNLFSSMADPSEKLVQYLGKLNPNLADGVKNSEDLILAFKELKSSGLELADAVQMVDVRARPAFFTLLNQADAVEGLMFEYRDLDGEAEKLATTMRDTLTNDMAIANSAFDAARRNLVELFIPSLRGLAQEIALVSETLRFLIIDFSNFGKATEKNIQDASLWGTTVKAVTGLFNMLHEAMVVYTEASGVEETVARMKDIETTTKSTTDAAKTQLEVFTQLKKAFEDDAPITNLSEMFGMLGGDFESLSQKYEDGLISQTEAEKRLFIGLEQRLNSTKSSLILQQEKLDKLNVEIKALGILKKSEEGLTEAQNTRLSLALTEANRLRPIVKQYTALQEALTKILKVDEVTPTKIVNDELGKKNKKLDEQIRLTYQLNEAKLQGDLAELEKLRSTGDTKQQLAFEELLAKKKIEIAKLKYDFEIRQIEELYKEDKDYLLRRQIAYENFSNEINKILDGAQENSSKVVDKLIKDSEKVTDDAIKNAKKGALEGLDALVETREENIKNAKDEAKRLAKIEKEKWDTINKITQQAAQGLSRITTFAFDSRQASRENELRAIDKWEQERLALAGDNEDAKKAIEEEAEKRRQKIKIQQAKDDKKEAMFQIILDTAVNIVKSFPNVLQMALAGALGAAQLAIVANRPLPQFYKGTDDSPEGFAQVGERGRELVQDGKTKKWSLTPDKTTVAYLTKGSKVITNAETERVLAQDHNGRANQFLQSKVIVKDNNKINYKMIGQEVGKAVSTIPVNVTNFDEKGVTKYVMKRSSKITRLNKRY